MLGICGGIAAYKIAELVRLLRKEQIEVRVIMTHSAMQFISPLTFQALTGKPVATELLDAEEENAMGHINLARWADILLIAPATAHIMAKLSHGFADDLLSTVYLAATCPVYIAPAMNQAMWSKTVTQENVQRLKSHGVQFIGPECGDQACGETGFGRLSEVTNICERLIREESHNSPLKGLKILITAGPTREPLDPVRYVTNRSSGKMGYALAKVATSLGATVTLVSGPVYIKAVKCFETINVETAEQMHHQVLSIASKYDIYIGAAAVADYSPADLSQHKIKKQNEQQEIKFKKTKDIIADVAVLTKRPGFVVGFAAETENLQQYAQNKLTEKKLDMIAANWVGKEQGGFDKDENALHVFWQHGGKQLEMTDKIQLAEQLLLLIVERMNEKNTA